MKIWPETSACQGSVNNLAHFNSLVLFGVTYCNWIISEADVLCSYLFQTASFCLSLHSQHFWSTVWSMMSCLPIERSTTLSQARILWTGTKSLSQMLFYLVNSVPKGKDLSLFLCFSACLYKTSRETIHIYLCLSVQDK